jgi:hypothetical protein
MMKQGIITRRAKNPREAGNQKKVRTRRRK